MSASGRNQPVKTAKIHQSERPVLGKADITLLIPKQVYLTVITADLRTVNTEKIQSIRNRQMVKQNFVLQISRWGCPSFSDFWGLFLQVIDRTCPFNNGDLMDVCP
jgi:hypothetical protein